jgi:hypothetical protein
MVAGDVDSVQVVATLQYGLSALSLRRRATLLASASWASADGGSELFGVV